jgi:hypothetical protein
MIPEDRKIGRPWTDALAAGQATKANAQEA